MDEQVISDDPIVKRWIELSFKAGQQAGRREVLEWDSHPCPHYVAAGMASGTRKCPVCQRAKLEEWKLSEVKDGYLL